MARVRVRPVRVLGRVGARGLGVGIGLGRVARKGVVIGTVAVLGVLVACAILFWVFERGDVAGNVRSVLDGFEWVTRVLVQGEPPWEAQSGVGKFLFYLVVLSGIGLIAIITGAIASKIVQAFMRREAGMTDVRTGGHVLICGWGPNAEAIVRALRSEEIEDPPAVVILAPLDHHPMDDGVVGFVRGIPSSGADLRRAGVDRAVAAIILADHSNPMSTSHEVDAKTLLTTLAVESISRDCYTCVEVIRPENREHFERTNADELIVSAELTGGLLAGSALHHGLSRVVSDLLTQPRGSEFYSVPVPPALAGRTFLEAMTALKDTFEITLVAVADAGAFARYHLNPPASRTLRPEEVLLVIAESDPTGLIGSMPEPARPERSEPVGA